ncbi:hypothetical protein ACGFMK_24695 [Amycolatopsis sp. NPDC049252]|uniref:hypothetical protein n=1 Tax=Amycolatopsis sp. NPDC049252 TaxID=3363933 RepID=UPI00371402D8
MHEELDRARDTFRALVDGASAAALRRPSDGTRWTNEQLLYHMLFGYLVVRSLLVLVHPFGRLPDRVSRGFARVLAGRSRACTGTSTAKPKRRCGTECTTRPAGTRSSRTT